MERVPADVLPSLREHSAGLGCPSVVVVAPAGGLPTLLVARERRALERAEQLERVLLRAARAPALAAAAAEMGALLGYPACCVEAFDSLDNHDDTSLAWALLAPAPRVAAAPTTQWLHPHLALCSHSPCSLECAPTSALVTALADALDRRSPGFRAAWLAQAQRVHCVDGRGARWSLELEGDVVTARELHLGGDGRVGMQLEAGARVEYHAGGLVAPGPGWYAPLVADHSGVA